MIGRVRYKQRLRIGRHIHHEHMADPPVGPQAAHLCRDGAHQFVGMQAALHQQLALGGMNELDALCRRRLAVRSIDELERGDVEAELAGRIPDFLFGSDQHRPDDAGRRTVDDAAQRAFIAGVHDNSRRWRRRFGHSDQSVILARRTGLA